MYVSVYVYVSVYEYVSVYVYVYVYCMSLNRITFFAAKVIFPDE